jgi:hypothetical protein
MSQFLTEERNISKISSLRFTVRRIDELSNNTEESLKMKAANFYVEINELFHAKSTNFAKSLWQLNFILELNLVQP